MIIILVGYGNQHAHFIFYSSKFEQTIYTIGLLSFSLTLIPFISQLLKGEVKSKIIAVLGGVLFIAMTTLFSHLLIVSLCTITTNIIGKPNTLEFSLANPPIIRTGTRVKCNFKLNIEGNPGSGAPLCVQFEQESIIKAGNKVILTGYKSFLGFSVTDHSVYTNN